MMMISPKFMTCLFIYLLIFPSIFDKSNSELDPDSSLAGKKAVLRERVRSMFNHAYYSYASFGFPHDELKPLTKDFTDSFTGFENSKRQQQEEYTGSSITLIDSLSSHVVMGQYSDFKIAVKWLSENLNFDVDARINLYEWNTRVLGGLLSAHIFATDLLEGTYDNELLDLAENLGIRLLPAFDTPTGLPYAWINLKYGVMTEEIKETTTAECGSLILEMGTLSRLTCDTRFESAALRALRKLWSMRSSLDLLGTKLNVVTGNWIDSSSGIDAGMDSFYEYLIKAHVLLGRDELWTMFQSAYIAVQRYMRYQERYKKVDMRTGEDVHRDLTSLQAFWPGVQVLLGDIASANSTHRDFFYFWELFGLLPERFLWKNNKWNLIERQYPLRPEFAESTFYLYQATKDPWYLGVGEVILDSLIGYTEVKNGYACIKDVTTMELEDLQPGHFLSETCKYLYLLFSDSFLNRGNYILTTKGHPLPVMSPAHEMNIPRHGQKVSSKDYWALYLQQLEKAKQPSALSNRVCPSTTTLEPDNYPVGLESACHVLDARTDHRCYTDEDCGVDSVNCIPRECSAHGYCGDWYFEIGSSGGGWILDKNNGSSLITIFEIKQIK